MHRIIANQRHRAARWAQEHFFAHRMEWGDNFAALLLEKDGAIRAATFFDRFYPRCSIDMHIAAVPGSRWMTRDFLRASFRYPFLQLGVRRLGANVAANNGASLRLAKHVGFVLEGVSRDEWAEGVDVLRFGMKRNECCFLDGEPPIIWRIEHGQAFTAATA
jgi:RimJ/RimL family protein N-acetyltransferase